MAFQMFFSYSYQLYIDVMNKTDEMTEMCCEFFTFDLDYDHYLDAHESLKFLSIEFSIYLLFNTFFDIILRRIYELSFFKNKIFNVKLIIWDFEELWRPYCKPSCVFPWNQWDLLTFEIMSTVAVCYIYVKYSLLLRISNSL